MWIIKISARTNPAKRREYSQTLEMLVKESRLYKGCLQCDYTTEPFDQDKFIITSQWHSHKEVDDYMNSHLYKVLCGAIRVLCEEHDVKIEENANKI